MGVGRTEGGRQALAPLAVQAGDALAKTLDRGDEVVAFADEDVPPLGNLVGLCLGPEIDRAEPLALLAIALEPRLDLGKIGERRAGLQCGEARGFLGLAI